MNYDFYTVDDCFREVAGYIKGQYNNNSVKEDYMALIRLATSGVVGKEGEYKPIGDMIEIEKWVLNELLSGRFQPIETSGAGYPIDTDGSGYNEHKVFMRIAFNDDVEMQIWMHFHKAPPESGYSIDFSSMNYLIHKNGEVVQSMDLELGNSGDVGSSHVSNGLYEVFSSMSETGLSDCNFADPGRDFFEKVTRSFAFTSPGIPLANLAVAHQMDRYLMYLGELDSSLLSQVDRDGIAPIMKAAECGTHTALEYLIEKGCDPWQNNVRGENAFYYVDMRRKTQREEVTSFMEQLIAKKKIKSHLPSVADDVFFEL